MDRLANALLLAGAIGMWSVVIIPKSVYHSFLDQGIPLFTALYGMSYLVLGLGAVSKLLVLGAGAVKYLGIRQ